MAERGEVVGPDMSGNGRQQELEEFGRRKYAAEEGMRHGIAMAATGMVVFAKFAHHYIEDELWVSEYDSLKEALAQPGIRRSEKYARNMASVYRTLVIERKVPVEELEGVDLKTLQSGLKALKAGDVKWQDLVDDAKALTRSDFERKWQKDKRGPNAPIDPDAEPERVKCEACGSWIEVEREDQAA